MNRFGLNSVFLILHQLAYAYALHHACPRVVGDGEVERAAYAGQTAEALKAAVDAMPHAALTAGPQNRLITILPPLSRSIADATPIKFHPAKPNIRLSRSLSKMK